MNRPEAAFKGISTAARSYNSDPADYLVQMPSHWMFEGTGLQEGDALGTLVAFGEQDYLEDWSPDVDVVLRAVKNDDIEVCASYYEKGPAYGFPDGKGGAIFAAGTIKGWMLGLQEGSPGFEDVRRVTRNIIDHMLDAPPPAPPPERDCTLIESCFLVLADLDDDGVIGFNDLIRLMDAWGPCEDCGEDIDNDGVVGVEDLVTLLGHWE